MARYGGNFRGFKAKFAEANGAAGLIIFTDPKDSGYTKGLVYPDGPYYNESSSGNRKFSLGGSHGDLWN